MRKISAITILLLLSFALGIATIQTTKGDTSPCPKAVEDQTFLVHHTFWAFGGFYPVCSFEAAAGDYIQFTVTSTNSDPDRPQDKYIIELQIASTNHSTTTIQGTQFTNIIQLNYSDTYNITAAKQPFSNSVTINGKVTIHHQLLPATTNAPSTSPSLNPALPPSESNSTNPNTGASSVPEFSALATLPLVLSLFIVGAILL